MSTHRGGGGRYQRGAGFHAGPADGPCVQAARRGMSARIGSIPRMNREAGEFHRSKTGAGATEREAQGCPGAALRLSGTGG